MPRSVKTRHGTDQSHILGDVADRFELGEFLRSRRARLRPEDVGLVPFGGRRRVPGLRREELAQLAGVSVDYYVRLEQGRGTNVSGDVLDAVARVLRLDRAEHEHLRNLARPTPKHPARSSPRQRVRPQLQSILDTLGLLPAYVLGPRMDVLAFNDLADKLLQGALNAAPARQRNMLRLIFLDRRWRNLYADWEKVARDGVAYLRLEAGTRRDDPELHALVGELSLNSEEFRRWWAAHNVRDKTHGRKRFNHPDVGPLTLAYETLRLPDQPDQALVVLSAEAGSASEQALRQLDDQTALPLQQATRNAQACTLEHPPFDHRNASHS